MILHGASYLTDDLDIVYARDAENIRNIVSALKPYSPQLRTPSGPVAFRFDETTIKNGMNFTLVTSLGDIDLLGEIAGIGQYAAVRTNSQPMLIERHTYHVLSLAGLVRAKKASGRRKDLTAIPELEALEELARRTDIPKFE